MSAVEDWDAFADWRQQRDEAAGDVLFLRDHIDSGEDDRLDREAAGYYDEDAADG